jgi:succinate dehydrogenase / fumarate reductase iron-sulfur subunit
MTRAIKIKRQNSPRGESYWQRFLYEGDAAVSVGFVLSSLNERGCLTDIDGAAAAPVAWERGCLERKCGACAMRINGKPSLACSTFLDGIREEIITLEPLSKFPVVKDLIVDRSGVFETLKKLELWLDEEAYNSDWTREERYQSARCLQCGCCLEVCPNFSAAGEFAGALGAVSAYHFIEQERGCPHRAPASRLYQRLFFEGCGKSLACHAVCPLGLPVEELLARSNAAAVWGK